jgi:hypothetical protein
MVILRHIHKKVSPRGRLRETDYLEKPISIAFLLYVQNLTNHGILVQ